MRTSTFFFLIAIIWLIVTGWFIYAGNPVATICVLVVGLLIGCGLDARKDEWTHR